MITQMSASTLSASEGLYSGLSRGANLRFWQAHSGALLGIGCRSGVRGAGEASQALSLRWPEGVRGEQQLGVFGVVGEMP